MMEELGLDLTQEGLLARAVGITSSRPLLQEHMPSQLVDVLTERLTPPHWVLLVRLKVGHL